MTPDSPKTPREELEIRLTALLLGESSAEEAAELRQAMEQDAELRQLHERLKQTIGLVREAASVEEETVAPTLALRLSAERRENLLTKIKAAPPKQTSKQPRKIVIRWRKPAALGDWLKMAAMVTALLALGGLLVSNRVKKTSTEFYAARSAGFELADHTSIERAGRELLTTTVTAGQPAAAGPRGTPVSYSRDRAQASLSQVPQPLELQNRFGSLGGGTLPKQPGGGVPSLPLPARPAASTPPPASGPSLEESKPAASDSKQSRARVALPEFSEERSAEGWAAANGRSSSERFSEKRADENRPLGRAAEADRGRFGGVAGGFGGGGGLGGGLPDAGLANKPASPGLGATKNSLEVGNANIWGANRGDAELDKASKLSRSESKKELAGIAVAPDNRQLGWSFFNGTRVNRADQPATGVAWGDYDKDGFADLYQRQTPPTAAPAAPSAQFQFGVGVPRREASTRGAGPAAVPPPPAVAPAEQAAGLPIKPTVDANTGLPVAQTGPVAAGAHYDLAFGLQSKEGKTLAAGQPVPDTLFRGNNVHTDSFDSADPRVLGTFTRESAVAARGLGDQAGTALGLAAAAPSATLLPTPPQTSVNFDHDFLHSDASKPAPATQGAQRGFFDANGAITSSDVLFEKLEAKQNVPATEPTQLALRKKDSDGDGLYRFEIAQESKDKAPALGDLALAGRSFRTESAPESDLKAGERLTEERAKQTETAGIVQDAEAGKPADAEAKLKQALDLGGPQNLGETYYQNLARLKPAQGESAPEPRLNLTSGLGQIVRKQAIAAPDASGVQSATLLSVESADPLQTKATLEDLPAKKPAEAEIVAGLDGGLKRRVEIALPEQAREANVALAEPEFIGVVDRPNEADAKLGTLAKKHGREDAEVRELTRIREQVNNQTEDRRAGVGGVYSANVVGYVNLSATNIAIQKPSPVEIVELAQAQPAQSLTLRQRISRALTGGVERSARLSVDKEAADNAPLDGTTLTVTAGYDPNWIQSDVERIQSKSVLNKAIEKLNLNEAWAKKDGASEKLNSDQTYKLLKDRLDVRQTPNSNLIDIRVKSDNADEAARIANTIAEVYRDARLEERKQRSLAGVKALEEQLGKSEQKIAHAKQELERLQEKPAGQQLAEDRPVRKSAPNAPIPQPEVQTSDNTFSTFSLNVSDVSFKLAAASLEKGQMPEPATVRSEEFINAFDYRDPEPPPGVPVAFAWERARYPFAHNRDMVRFSVKTAASGRQAGRPLNLVLLLDNSGSMERADRVRIIQECLRVLASQLQPQDRVSVVSFARTPRLWVDGLAGGQANEMVQRVGSLTPEGGTNLEEAMKLAYETARRHYLANGMNRVVLLTDGAANLGDVQPESLKKKVEAHRKQGIALDCFGVGWDGYNDDLLEVLSRNGDGRYGFVNTPGDAVYEFAGQLAGALKVAASDVKVQVEFNPRRVTTYRQIGYAKHQLTKEQFRDNTVDAAEIGAAEAGKALYVVQVNPRGEGPLGVVRVRFKVPGTTDYREHEWSVPYEGASKSLEQSSPAMRLAASASAFSEWLVSSPFAGEVTLDRLLGYLSGVTETYGADPRPARLEWMIRQAKSVAGK